MTPKQRVLKEFPSAWFNAEARTIEGYSHSLILGHGSVIERSIEKSAWADAAKRLSTGFQRNACGKNNQPKSLSTAVPPERPTHSPYDIGKIGQKEYPGE